MVDFSLKKINRKYEKKNKRLIVGLNKPPRQVGGSNPFDRN